MKMTTPAIRGGEFSALNKQKVAANTAAALDAALDALAKVERLTRGAAANLCDDNLSDADALIRAAKNLCRARRLCDTLSIKCRSAEFQLPFAAGGASAEQKEDAA